MADRVSTQVRVPGGRTLSRDAGSGDLCLVPPLASESAHPISLPDPIVRPALTTTPAQGGGVSGQPEPAPNPGTIPASTTANAQPSIQETLRNVCRTCLKGGESLLRSCSTLPGVGQLFEQAADFLGEVADENFPEDDEGQQRFVVVPQPKPPEEEVFVQYAREDVPTSKRPNLAGILTAQRPEEESGWLRFIERRDVDPVRLRNEQLVESVKNISVSRLDSDDVAQLKMILTTNGVPSPLFSQLERILADRARQESAAS